MEAEQANPYAPPKAALDDAQPSAGRFYTPWQVSVVTLLGGPIAGGILLFRNYCVFGARSKGNLALGISTGVVLALVSVGVVRPDLGRGLSWLSFVIAAVYRSYATTAFGSEIAERRARNWTRQPWWHVIVVGIAVLVSLSSLIFAASLLVRGR
jgi:hypothetical protein